MDELWNRVLWEITSHSVKHLLHTHSRLVTAGVGVGKHIRTILSLEKSNVYVFLFDLAPVYVLTSHMCCTFQMAHVWLWNWSSTIP